MTDRPASGRAPRSAPGALRQASRPHDPVRDDRGSADLCAVGRQFPPELAERPPFGRLHGRACARLPRLKAWSSETLARDDSRHHRRARGRHEDRQPAPPACRDRSCRDKVDHEIDVRSVPWYRVDLRRLRHAALDRQRRHPRGRAGAEGRASSSRSSSTKCRCARRWCSYSVNILLVSLLISVITAMLVYLALHYLFVRPLRRITANMMAFHSAPENPASVIVASGRQRRDRHGRARARRHAARPRHHAGAEEPARRARTGGVQDQSRSAQSADHGAALFRPAGAPARSARAALRAQAHARARTRRSRSAN